MHVKIIKMKTKRKPPSSKVYRLLEFRQGISGMWLDGFWHAEDEVERNCKLKWILQAINSRRVDGRVVKASRHVLTMNFYGVVDTLCDINPDRHLEAFMETPYVTFAMERSFGIAEGSNADVQKVRAAVADIVTQIMTAYNESEEAVVRKENVAIRLEAADMVALEIRAYADKQCLLKMRELAIEEELRPIRETAKELAKQFIGEAIKLHHPDRSGKDDRNKAAAHEKVIVLKQLKSEIYTEIDNETGLLGAFAPVTMKEP